MKEAPAKAIIKTPGSMGRLAVRRRAKDHLQEVFSQGRLDSNDALARDERPNNNAGIRDFRVNRPIVQPVVVLA